jgi:hypothetical protein
MSLVNVLVPEERVLEVYALLGLPPGSTLPAPVPTDEWPQGDIIRFYRESPPAMKGFLDHLAGKADTWVTIQEMADTLDLTPQQVAGVMGAGGRRLHNRYGKQNGRKGWFLDFERNHELGMLQYRMPAKVAEAIREVKN